MKSAPRAHKDEGDFACIHDPARADEFRSCGIDPERVPIKSMIPVAVSVPQKGQTTAYEMDIRRLTKSQRAELCKLLARKFGYTPEQVEQDLNQVGCPILTDNVTAFSTQPWKYLP